MSEGPNWPTPESQPEAIHWKVVLGSIFGTLALFTLSVFIVWLIERDDWRRENANPSIPMALTQPEVNELETVTFPLATLTYVQQQEQLQRLRSWGWLSRKEQVIHIPIDLAIDDLLAGKIPSPGRQKDAGAP